MRKPREQDTHKLIAWPGKGPQGEEKRTSTIMFGTEEGCRNRLEQVMNQHVRIWSYRILEITEVDRERPERADTRNE